TFVPTGGVCYPGIPSPFPPETPARIPLQPSPPVFRALSSLEHFSGRGFGHLSFGCNPFGCAIAIYLTALRLGVCMSFFCSARWHICRQTMAITGRSCQEGLLGSILSVAYVQQGPPRSQPHEPPSGYPDNHSLSRQRQPATAAAPAPRRHHRRRSA